MMKLDKGIPVEVGPIKGKVFGGRFKLYEQGTRRLVGVKMAAEIDHPCEISIPTEDFSIPEEEAMVTGIILALSAMKDGHDVYAGCMGGIGRTGLFMGVMAKVMFDYEARQIHSNLQPVADPVMFVRKHYIPHAIETQEQQDYVRTFDTTEILDWIEQATAPKVIEKEVVKTVEVQTPVWPTPWDYFMRLCGFR